MVTQAAERKSPPATPKLQRPTAKPVSPQRDRSQHYLVRRVLKGVEDQVPTDDDQPSTSGREHGVDVLAAGQRRQRWSRDAQLRRGAQSCRSESSFFPEIARSKLLNRQISAASSLLQLRQLFSEHASRMDHIHTTALLIKLSHIVSEFTEAPAVPPHCQQFFEQLMAKVGQHLDALDARGCSSILWVLGKFRSEAHSPLVQEIVDTKLQRRELRAATATDLANIAWGLARLHHPGQSDIWGRLLEEAARRVGGFKPQELSMVLWALAQSAHLPKPDATAAVAGGCSIASARSAFCDAACEQLLRRRWQRPEFNTQMVCTLVWALAKLGHYQRQVFIEASRFTVLHLRSNSAHGLSSIAWAFATVRHYDPLFTSELLRCAEWKARRFSCQGLANLMWAMAAFGHYNHRLYCFMAREVSRQGTSPNNPSETVNKMV